VTQPDEAAALIATFVTGDGMLTVVEPSTRAYTPARGSDSGNSSEDLGTERGESGSAASAVASASHGAGTHADHETSTAQRK
jgi:hypothetical protein